MLKIVPVETSNQTAVARRLFEEYAAALPHSLCFQSFEQELRELPGHYAPPGGRLLLALADGDTAGCVALRARDHQACEMKRLYVRPAYRRQGLGRRLAETAVAEARVIGYTRVRLDTLGTMTTAIALYRSLGFVEIPPYYPNPIPGAVYLELELSKGVMP